MRQCEKTRKTNETQVFVKLNIDGNGEYKINTGIKFFDAGSLYLSSIP